MLRAKIVEDPGGAGSLPAGAKRRAGEAKSKMANFWRGTGFREDQMRPIVPLIRIDHADALTSIPPQHRE
jgi:hypothetical protein